MQIIHHGLNNFITEIKTRNINRVFVVCGKSAKEGGMKLYLANLNTDTSFFSGYSPNPKYEDVLKGLEVFKENGCNGILAIGGGSTIDTAKCIKLYNSNSDSKEIPLIAIPTTAGSGSESTRHAVVYKDGVKQSISDRRILPDVVFLEPSLLETLSTYQKKCTMMDALCQAIESWWSKGATEESIAYSEEAIKKIKVSWDEYVSQGGRDSFAEIMEAANLSGRAIDITKTTAPHAMSYKLTSRYGLPHGHAVALCMREVWRCLRRAISNEPESLQVRLSIIEKTISFEYYCYMLDKLEIIKPVAKNRDDDIGTLVESVNPERLSNHPIYISKKELFDMYDKVVDWK